MARENPSWGEGRIADELSLKLGVLVDARTVGKYMKQSGRPRLPAGNGGTFVQNHAHEIVAVRFLYLDNSNVPGPLCIRRNRSRNASPIACERDGPSHGEWTRQQFRAFLDGESGHRYVIYDRDCFLSRGRRGAQWLWSESIEDPVRSPMAKRLLRTVIGTIRRECLDYLIPLNARHVKRVVSEFATHYNRGRPHTALGPGLPEPSLATMPVSGHRHRMPSGYRVAKTPLLGGLHHEYRLEQDIA
jgi:hypothetical protein